MDQAKEFNQLFFGRRNYRGVFNIDSSKSEKKKTGKAQTLETDISREAWEALWSKHLRSEEGLGVIPIHEGDECMWAAIDVDVYPLDLDELAVKVADAKLPLYVLRSKSGGAHLVVFFSEPAPCAAVIARMKEIASDLGYPGVEVFPKQARLQEGAKGNWLNMPYFAALTGSGSDRHCVTANGGRLSAAEFLKAVTRVHCNEFLLATEPLSEPPNETGYSLPRSVLEDAPPCLNTVLLHGPVGEGLRNNMLFNLGVYAKKAYPDDWEAKLVEYNAELLDPSLDPSEMTAVVKSLGRGDYFYKCGDQPICDVCDKAECRQRKHGMGGSPDRDVDKVIADLNEEYFVVRSGNKTSIARLEVDDLDRQSVQLEDFGSFKNFLANQRVLVGMTETGKPINRGAGQVWTEHPDRRTYDQLVYRPEMSVTGLLPDFGDGKKRYNLWRGFGVEPEKGEFPRLKDFLCEIVCGGDVAVYEYLVRWCAHMLQNLGEPGQVCFVMRGKRGVGKGTFAEYVLAPILQHHSFIVSSADQVVGRFNAYMGTTSLLVLDEAFWAGDKRAAALLKKYITDRQIAVEPKFRDIMPSRNVLHLVIIGNEDWLVPAGPDERRFFVVDVSDKRKQDRAYFKELHRALDEGERAAFLFDLLHMDLSEFDIAAYPRTAASVSQQQLSLNLYEEWWYSCLLEERVGTWAIWEEDAPRILTADTQAAFGEFIRKRHPSTHWSDASLGKSLKEMLLSVDRRTPYPRMQRKMKIRYQQPDGQFSKASEYREGNGYVFPSLEECRTAFNTHMGAGWEGHEW